MMCALLLGRAEADVLMPGADDKWRHLQSPNFEVYSRNSEGDSRQLLYNLELVHAIFFETFGFTPVRTMPVTVYFFSRDRHFEFYNPAGYEKVRNIAAFYHPELDRGVMTVAPLPSYEAAQQLAFGSYTYHLLRLMDEAAPVWFSQGVAGVFQNLELLSKEFELGRSDANRVGRLQQARFIPVEAMFAADHQTRVFRENQNNHLFRDESWALVHYLYFGRHELPRDKLSAFVRHVLEHSQRFDAETTRRVFEELLGISYAELNKRLGDYLRKGRYVYTRHALPKVAAAGTYALRRVPKDEINLRLAELALRVNRAPQGRLLLLQGVDRLPEDVRLYETLGADAAKDGDWHLAAEWWGKALAHGSENPAALHELAMHEGRQRFSTVDLYYRLPAEATEHLRTLLHKSIAASPRQAQAYELLAWVEATAQTPSIRNVNLVQAHFNLLKQPQRTLLALAMVRLRLGMTEDAAKLLNAIENAGADAETRYALEIIRAHLEGRPVNQDHLPVRGQAQDVRIRADRINLPR